jgi:hypothetical protein
MTDNGQSPDCKLLVHGFPRELRTRMKAAALDEGKTLRQWIIDALNIMTYSHEREVASAEAAGRTVLEAMRRAR